MSTRRHAKHSKRKNKNATTIGANYQNLKSHRKLIPNLKFKDVPIVEIDVNLIKTSNFIDKVSEYSKRPDIIESGGFFIMRPKPTQKHRYLIDPQKIEDWDPQNHSDKHYFINHNQHNCSNHKPYNKQWVYDIPQLSKTVNDEPLLVGSFPQRTCDVLTPLFTDKHTSFSMTEFFEKQQISHGRCKYNKRKRNEETEDDYGINHTKRRKLNMPKVLNIPKRDTLFDLTQHKSFYDDTTSNPLPLYDTLVLSTNMEPIEMTQHAFDVLLWDKLLSKPVTTPPITICDMAIDGDDDTKSDIVADLDIEALRGFAFIVNQFDAESIKISSFWRADELSDVLLHSPYDNASAEDIPLIFASHIIRGDDRYYGIIGDNITVYQEKSPLDLINLALYGPFAEFKEGGRDNEYRNGVHQPYIYLGNRSTWFAWHREDMNLYAVNHLLWGNDKVWYCVAPQYTHRVLQYVRAQYAEYCGDHCWIPLQHKQYCFDPYTLICMGIDVYFMRQKAGDIMITPPGGLHCGLNAGVNMAESVNFMTYDIECWKICLSAMHFALFNRCQTCLNSVWINFNELAERCRNSSKCKGKIKRNAPSTNVVPYYEEEITLTICTRLTKKVQSIKRSIDPISVMNGERLWIYPVRRSDAKYWFPAIWIEACYSWDTLVFEMLYRFKYLDSGTIKGFNEPELFTRRDVLWDKGLLIWDWNRTQRFAALNESDKKCIANKYSYPRRQGNMLINYMSVLNKDYKNMYYKKCVYYQCFPHEIQYKDLYKKKKNCNFRSHKEMENDIDKQHIYFTKPIISIINDDDVVYQ